ncbi:acetyl/propionyl/methylcrotonyl-CoA carboxylase subunit alpha [Tepidicaulis sp. LMO-SS28]|uniref:acetyl/propionyl/methylcrotonyl-CoA carboxylase subunit alpha n=1 Tax=Tepidicaulis sp. LMO-SS28 TaxID=3447455 RepID=UPI003EDF9B41
MFNSVLIANRGEIAVRVMHTAKVMGLKTIAVFSEADRDALHVALADEAYCIGPAPANESYLKADAILEVAKQSGAEAIHPGYGFLSENAAFAEACEKAGVIFIGPPASAIRAMGLKDAAKALMEKAGVPVVPGYHGEDQDAGLLAKEAKRIGYPVLIKAVAGGGGKGMRRVDAPEDFEKALKSAQREAASAFGDERVLIEKFVTQPRHVEIQVFADGQGDAVYLFERDCSLQRRHQKVIEEAPAPGMPEEMRKAMGEAAVKAAKAIGYKGAGTIEFIADASEGLQPGRFFFMEMNTRLQVEHPVTEMITATDLVEWQLRVAAGEKLPLRQSELEINGHAIEARLYAEDPAKQFFPSTGTLHRLRLPEEDEFVRIDTGVREGDAVSMFYDPMIAKLIVWDASRDAALRRMKAALEEVEIAGLKSNAAFLARVAGHAAFRAGDIDTGFIDRHLTDLVPPPATPEPHVIALAALHEVHVRGAQLRARDAASPWTANDGWELGGARAENVPLLFGGEALGVTVQASGKGWRVHYGEHTLYAEGSLSDDGALQAVVDGRRVRASAIELNGGFVLMRRGVAYEFTRPNPLDVDFGEEAGGEGILAPMPGKIIQVLTEAGKSVRKGDALIVLEAMKMEQTLQAPGEGVVASVNVSAGDQVEGGAVLLTFEDKE